MLCSERNVTRIMVSNFQIFPLCQANVDSETEAMYLAQTATFLGKLPHWKDHAIIFY